MRMRTKKNLIPRLERVSHLICSKPEERKGKWASGRPLHFEIGCGKGDFISELAERNPDIQYVALEVVKEAAVMALEKVDEKKLANVIFILEDAKNISEYFDKGEVDRIYLNFSDPWPKKKKSKRRLTHPDFLKVYKEILNEDGEIHQKTDNLDFFEFSLESYKEMDYTLYETTYDLHSTDFRGNIMTEYEKRFVAEGKPICRVVAKLK